MNTPDPHLTPYELDAWKVEEAWIADHAAVLKDLKAISAILAVDVIMRMAEAETWFGDAEKTTAQGLANDAWVGEIQRLAQFGRHLKGIAILMNEAVDRLVDEMSPATPSLP